MLYHTRKFLLVPPALLPARSYYDVTHKQATGREECALTHSLVASLAAAYQWDVDGDDKNDDENCEDENDTRQ